MDHRPAGKRTQLFLSLDWANSLHSSENNLIKTNTSVGFKLTHTQVTKLNSINNQVFMSVIQMSSYDSWQRYCEVEADIHKHTRTGRSQRTSLSPPMHIGTKAMATRVNPASFRWYFIMCITSVFPSAGPLMDASAAKCGSLSTTSSRRCLGNLQFNATLS